MKAEGGYDYSVEMYQGRGVNTREGKGLFQPKGKFGTRTKLTGHVNLGW